MKVTFANYLRALRGTYKGSDLTWRILNGRPYASGRREAKDKQTTQQVRTRKAPSVVASSWRELTEAQRRGWQKYADAFLTRVVDGQSTTRRAYDVFKQANNRRVYFGLEIRRDPPNQSPPPALDDIALNSAVAPKDFSFVLTHAIGRPEEYFVVFRITAATPHPGCKPYSTDLRMIKGVGAESTVQLCESGGSVEFTDCRFAVNPGQRLMVEARVIRTEDGMPSAEILADLIR